MITVGEFRRRMLRYGATVAGDVVIEPPPIIVPPPALDIPAPGAALGVIVHHLEYAWDDVASWASDRFHDFLSGLGIVGAIGINDVEGIVTQAINFDITAWSSFVNQLNLYAQYIATDLSIGVTDLGNFVIDGLAYAENLAQQIGDFLGAVLGAEIVALGDRVTGLEHLIFDAIDFAAGGIEAWAIDNIYHPLLGEITTAIDNVRAEVLGELANVEDFVRSEVNAETLARIAALGGLAAAIASVATWVEDCGAPMCDTVGPKTDLGKWLKALNVASAAAFFAELAALDENGLEAVLRGVQHLSHGLIDDFDNLFVGGGGTLGATVAQAGG